MKRVWPTIAIFRRDWRRRVRVRAEVGAGLGDAWMDGVLGRTPINLDTPELQRFLAGKRVMVTGAGGSIGSEICRQAMRFCPDKMLLVERAENGLFEIDRSLRERWVGADVRPCLVDVCDARRMARLFFAERPHVVFHCAAHKHVPMMEANPGQAIRNNVFGTKIAADAAREAGAQAFVLVSTDKAVNPTSVMGATKRMAEMYVQSLNAPVGGAVNADPAAPPVEAERAGNRAFPTGVASGASSPEYSLSSATPPRFVAVRFGNVLGSSGSVGADFSEADRGRRTGNGDPP